MNIKCVTFTGADNSVNPQDMRALSKEFRIVEWAILFHPKKHGVPRYPTEDWVQGLADYRHKMKLSAHMCSTYVDDAINGYFEYSRFWFFQRVQFNMNGERLLKGIRSDAFMEVADQLTSDNAQVIVGGNYSEDLPNYCLPFKYKPLYDASGGRGIEPDNWPISLPERYCGYAGGLNPENLKGNLDKMSKVTSGSIWIDFESGIRTEDKLDFNKCADILETVYKWKVKAWKQSKKH